jgi:hypothetical protein
MDLASDVHRPAAEVEPTMMHRGLLALSLIASLASSVRAGEPDIKTVMVEQERYLARLLEAQNYSRAAEQRVANPRGPAMSVLGLEGAHNRAAELARDTVRTRIRHDRATEWLAAARRGYDALNVRNWPRSAVWTAETQLHAVLDQLETAEFVLERDLAAETDADVLADGRAELARIRAAHGSLEAMLASWWASLGVRPGAHAVWDAAIPAAPLTWYTRNTHRRLRSARRLVAGGWTLAQNAEERAACAELMQASVSLIDIRITDQRDAMLADIAARFRVTRNDGGRAVRVDLIIPGAS